VAIITRLIRAEARASSLTNKLSATNLQRTLPQPSEFGEEKGRKKARRRRRRERREDGDGEGEGREKKEDSEERGRDLFFSTACLFY